MTRMLPHPNPQPGTRQQERRIAALDPDSVQLEDRKMPQWLELGQDLAAHIKFQTLPGDALSERPMNWAPFFEDFTFESGADYRDFDQDLQKFSANPHGGLYRVYLQWLDLLKDDINQLTRRHLHFYYQQVLRLQPKEQRQDRVHVVFEPTGQARFVRIPEQTLLNAGKLLTYATSHEIFAGPAKLEALHAIRRVNGVQLALQADSTDGYGEPLTEAAPYWKPFGSPDLANMTMGFAFASPVLFLQEGVRTVDVTVFLKPPDLTTELPGDDALGAGISVAFSGSEEWLGPFTPESVSANREDNGDVRLVISVTIGAQEDPVSFYDVTQLEGGFDTVSPVMKVMLDAGTPAQVLSFLGQSTVDAVEISVSVTGAKDLDLENDFGRLNPDKPFLPFGPQPVRGSSLYVTSEEMLTKQVTDYRLRVRWQDPPADFAEHYRAYLKGKIHTRFPKLTQANLTQTFDRVVKNNSHFQASMSLARRGEEDTPITVQLFDPQDANEEATLASTPQIRPLLARSYLEIAGYFSVVRAVVRARLPGAVRLMKASVSPISRRRRRRPGSIDQAIRLPKQGRRRFQVKKRKFGVVQVTLLQGFLHRIYPHYLSATIADEDSTATPNEPYTPVVQSMELDYSAKVRDESYDRDDLQHFSDKRVQIFQLTPLGHAQQHAFLKGDLPFVADKRTRLLPHNEPDGALLIGIRNLEEGESISLLVQVAPGTANPEKPRQNVVWSILVRNHWRPFEPSEVLIDDTNHLLTSGIVRLQIPSEPLHDNTLLDAELTWLRASVKGEIDGVCDLAAIHLHAATAHVVAARDPANLQGSIASHSIAKLRAPMAGIKSIAQPYPSFGGAPPESPDGFAQRVSERLRHKQRAVTAHDYEHLVLDKFPEIHQVRCLTHADKDSNEAPGNVLLVVVPRTVAQARFDRLKPRADLDTISRISDFANTLNTTHVTASTQNPDYEELQIQLAVQFTSGHPFAPYSEILNEALISFLSPWAEDAASLPSFGGSVHKSQIIRFVECLDYVDFVTDVKLMHVNDPTDQARISPGSARAILVSASQHIITQAQAR